MHKGPKIFQMVIIGGFAVAIILGFLGFSGKLSLPTSKKKVDYGQVVLWGSAPAKTMKAFISANFAGIKTISISYVEKNAVTFNQDFVEALANGTGPDIIMLSQEQLFKNFNKLTPILYESLSKRDFINTYIEEGEMFMRPEGIMALPFIVDPIVMYWNRDIFTNALSVSPPKLWSEFYDLVPKITARDSAGNITRSLVSFGEYRNVTNAKEILSLLLMQAGSPIVKDDNGTLNAGLSIQGSNEKENPVATAIRFYTEFSNPNKDSYSWNRSLPSSRAMFEAGDLALYFGYASEYGDIKLKNPHLNFDVAVVPQAGDAPTKLTFGRIYGIGLVKASKNPTGSLQAATLLVSKNSIASISSFLNLPPVRRELISIRQSDPGLAIFYNSAIVSRSWYDPAPDKTDTILMEMLDNIMSGRSNMAEALLVANNSLQGILQTK